MDLYILNEIQKMKSGGAPTGDATSSPGIYPTEMPTETEASQTIVSISGIQDRYYHQSYDWNTNHPSSGQGWHAYDSDWRTTESKWRIPNGMGFHSFGGHGRENGNFTKSCRTHYATRGTVGPMHMQLSSGRNSNDYSPHCTNMMFVRNTTASDITKNVHFYYTNYWQNGYEGGTLIAYTPNHINYSQATRQNSNWDVRWNTSSGGGNHTHDSASVTFPANKTVALMHTNTLSYWDAFSYHTQHRNSCYFSHLHTIFDGTGQLVCDLQMSQVYEQARIPEFVNENYNQNESFFRFYNKCGEIFGDRTPA